MRGEDFCLWFRLEGSSNSTLYTAVVSRVTAAELLPLPHFRNGSAVRSHVVLEGAAAVIHPSQLC
jgi:hypothetical protein